jgi:alkylhydroperoxidase family enzyme
MGNLGKRLIVNFFLQEVFANLLRAAGHMLEPAQRRAWDDLPQAAQQAKVAAAVVAAVQDCAFMLAEVAEDAEYIEESSAEIRKFRLPEIRAQLISIKNFAMGLLNLYG